MSEDATLALPARVDAAAAADLYRQWRPRLRTLAAIDIKAVESIDSAGVALVQQLRQEAAAARGAPPLLHNTVPGYLQICRAHRLPADGD